jgi:signal transduction histidine kinase
LAWMSDWRSEERIFKFAHGAMLILFFLLVGWILSLNPEQRLILAGGYLLYFVLSLFRHLVLAGKEHRFWQGIFPYLEGLVVYLSIYVDVNAAGLSVLTLIIWDIALDYKYTYGAVYAFTGYLAYMSIYIRPLLHLPPLNLLLLLGIGAFQILLYVGFAFLAKGYSHQSRKLRETTAKLQAKMITAEEMTALKERNRIAMEMHNTVGHQLTTALVQIEAARLLLDQDPAESRKRLEISQEQVRQGLAQLRQAIHAIKADRDYEDFAGAVDGLLGQVRAHAQVSVAASLDDISEARLRLKKALYHMILESITNAIKHGSCRSIKIRLARAGEHLTLSCHNDGLLPKELKFGYGLSQIEEQVKELGGTFSVHISREGWFGLVAELPLLSREGDADAED